MGTKVLFWGDSITDGGRMKDNETDLNHNMGQSYACFINGKLGIDLAHKEIEFINRGISANRIVDLYARIKEDVIVHSPNVVSILDGINDCSREIYAQSGAEPEKFERIYRLVLDEISQKLPHTIIVICEPFILSVGRVESDYERWSGLLRPLQAIVRKLAIEYKTLLVPLQDTFNNVCDLKPANYWVWDGVHPTVCGHELIAREWIRIVRDENHIFD